MSTTCHLPVIYHPPTSLPVASIYQLSVHPQPVRLPAHTHGYSAGACPGTLATARPPPATAWTEGDRAEQMMDVGREEGDVEDIS